MGLFSRARSSGELKQMSMSPAEAFAGIALAVVAADGYMADSEVSLLVTSISRMHLFRSYSDDVIRRMFDKLLGILRRQGVESLLNACLKALPHDLHDTIFAVATDLVLADGEVTSEEEAVLTDLCNALEIPERTADEIIRVMLIKNKG